MLLIILWIYTTLMNKVCKRIFLKKYKNNLIISLIFENLDIFILCHFFFINVGMGFYFLENYCLFIRSSNYWAWFLNSIWSEEKTISWNNLTHLKSKTMHFKSCWFLQKKNYIMISSIQRWIILQMDIEIIGSKFVLKRENISFKNDKIKGLCTT